MLYWSPHHDIPGFPTSPSSWTVRGVTAEDCPEEDFGFPIYLEYANGYTCAASPADCTGNWSEFSSGREPPGSRHDLSPNPAVKVVAFHG